MADDNNVVVSTEDINKLEKAKMDKLQEMLSEGKNPYLITKYDVTNHSKDIKDDYDLFEGKTVSRRQTYA